jgi:hypothetical protein
MERCSGEIDWDGAELFFCLSCGGISIRPSAGNWRCRACGVGGGNAHVGDFDAQPDWCEAGNRVQWRAQASGC